MSQLSLFNLSSDYVVNVAQVRHRSPFRYPGGKTWLVPRIYQWLGTKSTKPKELIEPFCGGAIVGLTAAFEKLAEHVTLVELDEQVAAVWDAIINLGQGEWLAREIENFELTRENVYSVVTSQPASIEERAFQTILLNRIAHGGILAPGAGLVKNGENGKGLSSRWYPATLAKRIRDIHLIRDRLTFIRGDALEVIKNNKDRNEVAFFIDPPYTAGKGKRAGSRLYTHFDINHETLFALIEGVRGDFLMTYDLDDYVQNLVDEHGLSCKTVAMQNTHLAKMKELIIGKNLSWMA